MLVGGPTVFSNHITSCLFVSLLKLSLNCPPLRLKAWIKKKIILCCCSSLYLVSPDNLFSHVRPLTIRKGWQGTGRVSQPSGKSGVRIWKERNIPIPSIIDLLIKSAASLPRLLHPFLCNDYFTWINFLLSVTTVIKMIRQSSSLSSEQPVSAFPGGHGKASISAMLPPLPFPEVLVQ